MMQAAAKIGDAIEFAQRNSSDGESPSTWISGRVMDLLPEGECVVQLSPFEPPTSIDLLHTSHKVSLSTMGSLGLCAHPSSRTMGLL